MNVLCGLPQRDEWQVVCGNHIKRPRTHCSIHECQWFMRNVLSRGYTYGMFLLVHRYRRDCASIRTWQTSKQPEGRSQRIIKANPHIPKAFTTQFSPASIDANVAFMRVAYLTNEHILHYLLACGCKKVYGEVCIRLASLEWLHSIWTTIIVLDKSCYSQLWTCSIYIWSMHTRDPLRFAIYRRMLCYIECFIIVLN